MAEIIMPKVGDAMTEGKVVKWYKKPGEAVKKGEAVAEIETDKVNLDLEAESDGTLGEYAANEGDMVAVGGVLTTLLAEGETAPAPAAAAAPAPDPQQRRATDKKDSVKHTTGEYHEAIEQRGREGIRAAPHPRLRRPLSRRRERACDSAPRRSREKWRAISA